MAQQIIRYSFSLRKHYLLSRKKKLGWKICFRGSLLEVGSWHYIMAIFHLASVGGLLSHLRIFNRYPEAPSGLFGNSYRVIYHIWNTVLFHRQTRWTKQLFIKIPLNLHTKIIKIPDNYLSRTYTIYSRRSDFFFYMHRSCGVFVSGVTLQSTNPPSEIL